MLMRIGANAEMAKGVVKLDEKILVDAKIVAAMRGLTVAQYVSEVLRPVVERDVTAALAERMGRDGPAKPAKAKKAPVPVPPKGSGPVGQPAE